MTDPFYTQNKFQNQGQNPQQIQNNSVPQQVQRQAQQQVRVQNPQQQQQLQQQALQISQQEQAILQQIQKLNQMLRTQQLAPQQQQSIAKQIQQYNQQLQYLAYQKQQLWIVNNRWVAHPQIKKKGGKVSVKKFLIGCGFFLILLVGGAAAMFYAFLWDPDRLASMWLNIESTKQLLQALSSIFFGLIVFVGFGLFIVNTYRLFTVKNKSKLGYIFWLFFGIILFGGAVILWIGVIRKIWDIVPSNTYNNQNLLISYANFKDGPYIIKDDLQLIAPVTTVHTLNWQIFNSQILTQLWTIDLNQLAIDLDCGNGTKIPMNLQTLKFDGVCMYPHKWNHQLLLEIDYVNIQTQEKLQKTVPAGFVDIPSEIIVTPSWTKPSYNDKLTEIIMGQVPRKVSFDANEVFKDFWLQTYDITWDVDDDGVTDRENDVLFTYTYKKAQVYNVNFRIPGLNDMVYTFPIRIEQSDVPICEINSILLKWTNYAIQTNFIEKNAEITDYIYSIIDVTNNKTIDTLQGQWSSIKYQFPGAGTYVVKVTFQTDEGKKGECESENMRLGWSDFDINYDLLYKTPSTPDFKSIDENNYISFEDGNIIINEIPTVIKLKINKIIPDNETATKKIFLNGESVLSLDENMAEITIDQNKEYTITIVVEDINRDMKTEENIKVKIKRDDIIGKMIVSPDYVWTDPFTVRFDASTSQINDPDDEIVYFTWDFGDWVKKTNISQSIVTHTYNYDYENENGTFDPSVVLVTKKGREITVNLEQSIIVKKLQKTFDINIDSHPGQLAKVWDRVNFSLDINGSPEKIVWDFDNGNTLECNGRECIEVSQTFDKAWTYKIKVTISDTQNPESESSVNLKVE